MSGDREIKPMSKFNIFFRYNKKIDSLSIKLKYNMIVSIRESASNVTIDVVMDGLRVKSSCFRSNRPLNFEILRQEFGIQSLDLLIELANTNNTKTKYRYTVDRLPTEIDVPKVKIKVGSI